jgi:hypothetical protein
MLIPLGILHFEILAYIFHFFPMYAMGNLWMSWETINKNHIIIGSLHPIKPFHFELYQNWACT